MPPPTIKTSYSTTPIDDKGDTTESLRTFAKACATWTTTIRQDIIAMVDKDNIFATLSLQDVIFLRLN